MSLIVWFKRKVLRRPYGEASVHIEFDARKLAAAIERTQAELGVRDAQRRAEGAR